MQPETTINEDRMQLVDGKLSGISLNDNSAGGKVIPKRSNRQSQVCFLFIYFCLYSEVSSA